MLSKPLYGLVSKYIDLRCKMSTNESNFFIGIFFLLSVSHWSFKSLNILKLSLTIFSWFVL